MESFHSLSVALNEIWWCALILVALYTWIFAEYKDVGLMWVCGMFDPFVIRGSHYLQYCPGIQS